MELDQRIEWIADLVERHQGGAQPEQIQREAKAVFAHLRPDEIEAVERGLTARQVSIEALHEVQRLHLDNLQQELAAIRAAVEPWHPVRTMLDEHDEILRTLEALEELNEKVQKASALERTVPAELRILAENLLAAEHHHKREEDVVFPELAKGGIGMTVKAMSDEHDELRAMKQALRGLADRAADMAFADFRQKLGQLAQAIVFNLGDHIYRENYILYPAALRMVPDKALWTELKRRCDEIGYCHFKPVH